MTVEARLLATRGPSSLRKGRPSGIVLVLHGGAGQERRSVPVSGTQLSVLRMIPVALRVARAGRGRLAVFRVLNSSRGWNTTRTPVDDVRWALDRVREQFGGGLPIGLVGHSLGGRAALLAASEPEVTSVVALAPWVYPSDGRGEDATGRRILIVHGTNDRIADPAKSTVVARTLSRTAEVGYISVAGGNHAMLGRHAPFDRYAGQFVAATLLKDEIDGPVREVLDGRPWVEA